MDGRHATTSGASAAGLRSTVDSTRKSSTSSLDGLRHVSTQEKSVIKRNSFLATRKQHSEGRVVLNGVWCSRRAEKTVCYDIVI